MSSINDVIYIGLDDGNAQHKISSKDVKAVFPTHIERSSGRYVTVDNDFLSNQSSEKSVKSYMSSTGVEYLVGDVKQPIPRTDEFPYSEAAQILIHHSLSLFGQQLAERKFVLCTGMPLRQFYKTDGTINEQNVKRKMTSMSDSFKHILNDEERSLVKKNIAGLLVQPEALTALFPYLYMRDGNGVLVKNPTFTNKTIAVVDPGGKTTDIAVFDDGSIDLDRCVTKDIGFNDLEKKASNYLYDLGFKNPTSQQTKLLINEGLVIKCGDHTHHTEWMNKSRIDLATQIFNLVKDTLSNAADIDHIIFIGGTISALKGEIQPLITEQYGDHQSEFCILPDNADRLNAEGLEIFAELWHRQRASQR